MEYNDYILLKPYEIKQSSTLVLSNSDTPCIGQVAYDYTIWGGESVYSAGEILIYDSMKSQRYRICGEDYIIVKAENIIARVDLEDGKKDTV